MSNHLKNQTSPYLLQHAENPVNWYPWCEEAFDRAKKENKPVFLSIGYSTCHWCHVMAHESFEDEQVAEILNKFFVAIKVDKEERPDIDSIYMSVCQAFTGSGGWPTTIFLTPEQKPFFAGTYFSKTAGYGQIGLIELLLTIRDKWITEREELLQSAEEIISFLSRESKEKIGTGAKSILDMGKGYLSTRLENTAVNIYKRIFDAKYGGFGEAPKFPAPHNLLFLMSYYEKSKDETELKMVEKTLQQMCRGGIFDHIGGGFSRYSTDRFFLAPHFEKMLYDNALLILAYSRAYQLNGNHVYGAIAKKTALYILREMTSPEGGFYSAQDADSEGVEGKYYLLEPSEIMEILGEKRGKEFNEYYDITLKGNFEGKNIPNLLQNDLSEEKTLFSEEKKSAETVDFVHIGCLKEIYKYRKNRYALHLDDKILTSWNGLMIAAMCQLYRVTGSRIYLNAAVKAFKFVQNKLWDGETLYISYREGRRSNQGLLDDYANMIFALVALYEATLDSMYLKKAEQFCTKVVEDFYDKDNYGFFLYGKENEQLILRPKETYDGAMPSGNSIMAYNLVRLWFITGEKGYKELVERQLSFMSIEAKNYPVGYAIFLMALLDYLDEPARITVAVKDKKDLENLACKIPLNTIITMVEGPSKEYPLQNDRTTFYICRGHACLPPVNVLNKDILSF